MSQWQVIVWGAPEEEPGPDWRWCGEPELPGDGETVYHRDVFSLGRVEGCDTDEFACRACGESTVANAA